MEKRGLEGIFYALNPRLSAALGNLLDGGIEEVRLRANRAAAVTVGGKIMYILKNGSLSHTITPDCFFITESDISDCYRKCVQNSVYAHLSELKAGYIVLQGGHRAGVCGTLSQSGNLRDITSLCFRVAREIKGVAEPYFTGGGKLIAGPPGSGKTTVLRDYIRLLSKNSRVVAIDSRGELSAAEGGKIHLDLGDNCDILCGYEKDVGLNIALRVLWPDTVAFDELGSMAELNRLRECFNCGVSVVCTAHIGSADELFTRPVTRELLNCGIINSVTILGQNSRNYTLSELKALCGC